MAEKSRKLPILPIKNPDLVAFPGLPCIIDIGRPISIDAVTVAKANNTSIIIAIQKDERVEEPIASDFYGICTEAEIKSIMPLDEEGIKKRVTVVGISRARLKTVGKIAKGEKKYLCGEMLPYKETEIEIDDKVKKQVFDIVEKIEKSFKHIIIKNKSVTSHYELSMFIDNIVGQLAIDGKTKVGFLSETDITKRLDGVTYLLAETEKIRENNLTAEPYEDGSEYGRLAKLAKNASMPDEVSKIVNQELSRIKNMNPAMSEYSVTANYIEILVTLPWNNKTEDSLDIEEAGKVLDRDHYGLIKPKQRILEYLAVRKLAPNKKGAILCFVGPPGCGKTSIAESIAASMNRKFIRMSLGGVHDEAEIRGHRRTYVGAMVGKIIQHIKKVGVNNPVFVLDEIDKLSKDYRGDPSAAFLEVLDPAQNFSFVDNYLNVPFDLSNVFFITTANNIGTIPLALQDRMEIIEIQGYSPHEKLNIARKHLIPKQKKENGLESYDFSFSTEAINRIIEEYTNEAGVRNLERECGGVIRKLAVMVSSKKEVPAVVEFDDVVKYLGAPKAFVEVMAEKPEIGLSTGLAWSETGGSLLFVEASLSNGKGDIKLTGNLGKVLQESATTALTWIKCNYEKYGIDGEVFSKKDVHLHFPAGATPKDGPSAGIAITAAMLSLFTGKPVRNDVAMTGEISLRGRVLPIGGLVEKVMAAHRGGIREVLYPIKNLHSLEEIPQDVKSAMILTPISNLPEAIEKLLVNSVGEGVNNLVIKTEGGLVNRAR